MYVSKSIHVVHLQWSTNPDFDHYRVAGIVPLLVLLVRLHYRIVSGMAGYSVETLLPLLPLKSA